MKRFTSIALFSILLLLASQSQAQNLIALQNGNAPKFYLQVDDAITNSVDGDSIFIPGGTWDISKPINKRLHITGVGYHTDSTKVTFPTTINGTLTIAGGASNGSLSGIFLQGQISTTNSIINYYTISRCRFRGITLNATNNNFIFIENIIEGGMADWANVGASYFSFYNNIITSVSPETYKPFINSVFRNNIFLYSAYWNGAQYTLPITGQFLSFDNNIILSTANFTGISNSVANNNLFSENISFPIRTNVGSNNIVNQARSSIFVNQTGNAFNYTHDYHLQASSPGKNAGTDGTDVGIYGGIYPWKAGSIPSNPHFQRVQISPKTDNSGNLNVKIKVAAQDR